MNKSFKESRLKKLDSILQSAKDIVDLSDRLEQFLSETIDMAEMEERNKSINIIEDYIININRDPFWNTDNRVGLLENIIYKIKSLSPKDK